ncbi:patched domain-containing protein 3-like [Mytilus edulis]|uniref:patched domain-containing protein 3-like n=1 Tax=Mytilus edulis TaxID=6550 RepID=UPI0039F1496C
MDVYRKVEDKISSAFGYYGKVISRNPAAAITFAILLNGLLGLNVMWITSENDIKTLYTPTNSQADTDELRIKSMFPDESNENFHFHQLPDLGHYGSVIFTVNDNIINKTYLPEIQSFHQTVMGISINDTDGKSYFYQDLCAINNGQCSVWGLWYVGDFFWAQVANGTLTYPTSSDPDGDHRTDREFGKVDTENGVLKSARSLRLHYYLRQQNKEYTALSVAWEKEFVKQMSEFKANLTDFTLSHSDSISTELDENTIGDIALFSLTFTIMITYASLVTAGGNCLTQRGHLGRVGVLATALAILGAFGLCGALGITYVNMVGIMPFLILGIGVDDMFILLSGLTDAPLRGTVEERISFTMRTTGVAITITSLTDLIAFMVGYMSDFMSVRHFCLYTGIAIILCYINQITFFLGCLVFHERRVASSRHCLTCQTIYTTEEMKASGYRNPLVYACCSGDTPEKKEDLQSVFEFVPTKILPKLVLNIPAKVVIALVYITYLVFSILGTTNLEQGLVLRNLVSEDSYYYKYSIEEYDNFPLPIPISFNIDQSLDYRDPQVVDKINNFIQSAQSNELVHSSFEINWLKEFYKSGLAITNGTKMEFCNKVRMFFQFAPIFKNDVVFNDNGTEIKYSRVYVITKSIQQSYEQGLMMQEMRRIAEKSGLPVFAYGQPFTYFEQYVSVLPNTMQTVGIAVAACFVITCIFMPHPLLIFLVTSSLVSIMVGVFGFMYYWGLSLSCITMIHVIMSVGFSVDFSAHICHAFMTVEGTDRNSKTNASLVRAGGPVFNCAFSSVIGICTLIFSRSFVFRSFFKVMFLVITFAFLHSVFVLPVILSFIGPLKKNDPTQRKTSQVTLTSNRSSATWSISGGVNALDTPFGNGKQNGRKWTS